MANTVSVVSRFAAFATTIPSGPGAQAFDDRADAGDHPVNGIERIDLWVEAVVTGLQVTYTLAGGGRYQAPLRGSKTGHHHSVALAPDEELIQISGRGDGRSVAGLRLLSCRVDGGVRLHGPFGAGEAPGASDSPAAVYTDVEMIVGGSDESGFCWFGGKIMAFLGHTRDRRLTGLGVATAPIVEVVEGLSSTSVLSTDYRAAKSGKSRAALEPYPVYRSTLALPADTREVTLWAEEQLHVVVDGRALVLDPVRPTVVAPNAWARVTVVVPATGLVVPAIKVRTDAMRDPWQWYTLHPDVAAHAKIAAWGPDTLFDQRATLGVDDEATQEDCAAIQAAVVNFAKLGLPGEGQAAHERRIDAEAMEQSDWLLDLTGDQAVFQPVDADGAREVKQQAVKVTRGAAGSSLKKLLSKGKRVAGGVGKVIVQTARTGSSAVVETIERGGEAAVDGAAKLGKDLERGSLELGRDVRKLGKHAIVTIIKIGGEAIEFVLDRTVALGKLIFELLEGLGVKMLELLEFLVDLIPWTAITETQKQLMDVLERALAGLAGADTGPALASLSGAFDSMRADADAALDRLTVDLGGKVEPSGGIRSLGEAASAGARPAEKAASKAMKQVEKVLARPIELVTWLVNKLLEKIPILGPVLDVLAAGAAQVAEVFAELVAGLGKAAKALVGPLGASITNLLEILKHPSKAPNYVAGAVLQLAKGLLDAGAELVVELASAALRGVQRLAGILLELGTVDLIPGQKKKHGIPFITDFYNFIVGGKLSLFKLITFLLAVPITLVHEAVFGSAPSFKQPVARANARQTTLVVAAGVCSLAELSINAFLDASALIVGVEGYEDIKTGTRQTVADQKSSLILPLEVSSLICSVLAFGLTSPLEFDKKPKNGEEVAGQLYFWLDAAQIALDIIGLVKDQRRMVRADLAHGNKTREGAWGMLLFEVAKLTGKIVVAVKYERHGSGFAADVLDGTGAVVEAALLGFFPDSNPTVAKVCVASDAAFGLASLGAGLAADLK